MLLLHPKVPVVALVQSLAGTAIVPVSGDMPVVSDQLRRLPEMLVSVTVGPLNVANSQMLLGVAEPQAVLPAQFPATASTMFWAMLVKLLEETTQYAVPLLQLLKME